MKNLKLLVVALVAMFGFIACDKHECNDYDHSADLVGTWTCLEAGYAEALVIKADGSALSTGVEDGEYWENVAGNIVVKDGKVTMTFEDGDNFEGYLDVVPGIAFTIHDKEGEYYTFNYCKEDLADEVIGMWVCTDGPTAKENDMLIQTYKEDGSVIITGYMGVTDDFATNAEGTTYKVVGDLMFNTLPANATLAGVPYSYGMRLSYSPNGTSYGDIITMSTYIPAENGLMASTSSWLRVKQSLDLAGKKYDYIKTFVTNVDGLDKDIDFMGYTFNFAKMDGTTIDQMLKALLFSVEFPSANKIKYSCRFSSGVQTVEAPIAVDGNKMTLKMSELYPTAKDVDLYTFQDADCSQMHMYMPTYAFINFFGNMQVIMMSQLGQLDTNNADAVKAVFDSIDAAVNTINVSFVMTKAAK